MNEGGCKMSHNEQDSTKVQTLGAISEGIMRQDTSQDTAPQLAISLLFDGPRAHTVYKYLSTESVSPRLAASASKPDCTSASPRCAGQLVAKASGKRGSGCVGMGSRAGRGRPMVRTCMLTPLINGLGHATWSSIVPVSQSRTPSF